MDETEWLACQAHGAMLEFAIPAETKAIIRAGRPVRDRKLYLFACAACRATWPLLTDPRLRSAVEVAERFADREATRKQLTRAWEEATAVARARGKAAAFAASAVCHLCASSYLAPGYVANDVRDALGRKASRPKVTDLLRDVYGNLFRPAVVAPAWRTPDVASLPLPGASAALRAAGRRPPRHPGRRAGGRRLRRRCHSRTPPRSRPPRPRVPRPRRRFGEGMSGPFPLPAHRRR